MNDFFALCVFLPLQPLDVTSHLPLFTHRPDVTLPNQPIPSHEPSHLFLTIFHSLVVSPALFAEFWTALLYLTLTPPTPCMLLLVWIMTCWSIWCILTWNTTNTIEKMYTVQYVTKTSKKNKNKNRFLVLQYIYSKCTVYSWSVILQVETGNVKNVLVSPNISFSSCVTLRCLLHHPQLKAFSQGSLESRCYRHHLMIRKQQTCKQTYSKAYFSTSVTSV